MLPTRTRLLGFLLLIALPAAGCKDRDSGAGAVTNGREIAVYCIRCETSGRITIAGDPEDETWPKKCPSCNRTGAYASANCPGCGKLVLIIDPDIRGKYGSPEQCPHCGRTWTGNAP